MNHKVKTDIKLTQFWGFVALLIIISVGLITTKIETNLGYFLLFMAVVLIVVRILGYI